MSMLRSSCISSSSSRLPREISILCRGYLQSRSFSSSSSLSYSPFPTLARAQSPSDGVSSSSLRWSGLAFPELPKFTARGSDITILNRPDQFYSFLINSIKNARRRIFLASLYIGKEETELVQTLHEALKAKPSLELHIITDFLRSTREHPTSTSSASLIASLQASFPSQVHLSLYHTPALHGLLARIVPKRYNEGWGLWHGKIYGFDDDVMLSGANLSKDYFTNRQDRYIVFKRHPAFADYLHELMQVFKGLSYSIKGRSASNTSGDNFDLSFINEPGKVSSEPVHDPRGFTEAAKERLQTFMAQWLAKSSSSLSPHRPSSASSSQGASFDTTIQPFLQMGQFDITQETDIVIPKVLEQVQHDEQLRLDWTSGYFGVRSAYKEGLLKSVGPVHIVCASPQANGFYQSPGFSKYIPPAYTYAESRFWKAIKEHNKTDCISIEEWRRDGWTYHSKGIWLSPSGSSWSSSSASSSPSNVASVGKEEHLKPHLTLIGSSNYGYRSAVRDVEVNAVIQTSSDELQIALGNELDNIRKHANDKVDDALFERKDRRVGPINKLAAKVIADML
ncbi:hypothetical protein P389DRAFT_168340 [Cystobasidium minutum MCA 4210]|uniref:uncharacterized protein n=1 Tax=Cystobasidium minutum MCA 4210 TaxID=1397322 RepID=UPI0034CE4A95|eukprot:jgi/Rhomi1/168340/fgenesh1_kg.2_\